MLWTQWGELKASLARQISDSGAGAAEGDAKAVEMKLASTAARARLFAGLQEVWSRLEAASISGTGRAGCDGG